jgi:hypothetical protein
VDKGVERGLYVEGRIDAGRRGAEYALEQCQGPRPASGSSMNRWKAGRWLCHGRSSETGSSRGSV